MPQGVSRRQAILAGTAGLAVGASASAAQARTDPDPRTSAEGQIKLTARLDGGPAFWVYSGVIYAVRPQQHPVPILAVSGCQAQWAVAQADGAYKMAGATLTYFRDLATGAFLETFDNPLNGKRSLVKPNFLSGGGAIYPPDGSSARAFGQIKAAVIAPDGFKTADPTKSLGAVRWSVIGDTVMLMTDRSWNVAAQPQLEAQTQSGDRAAFFDPRIRRMPARYTGTTIIPWMTWMDMADAPGHLVWHTSGEKGFSLDLAPADYRAQAGDMLDRLNTRPEM